MALILAAFFVSSCRNCGSEPAVSSSPSSLSKFELPTHFPLSLPVSDFVGALACAECHPSVYEEWKDSPHGRAMAIPDRDSVLGEFNGVPIQVSKGSIKPVQIKERYYMDVFDGRQPERVSVDLVLASGRQHQAYLSRTEDGQYRFLPLIWATPTKQWILISEYRANAMDPMEPDYWRNSDTLSQGRCMTCHLSQMTVDVTHTSPKLAWVDLSINCEACHGPGREHVQARKENKPDESYGDLLALTKHNDVKLCSKCHAAKWNLYATGIKPNISEHIFATLADRGFRTDGTQFSTSYQYAAQALSPCFLEGAADCSSCHDAHGQSARDLAGETAEAEYSNRQCNVCHRNLREEKSIALHSHHSPSVYCVDCHMSYSWITDSPKTVHRTSDHSVSIPHPLETIKHGLPNACSTCHLDRSPEWALEALKSWGYRKATKTRPWVDAIAAGRAKSANSAKQLLGLLKPDAPEFIIASALELLSTHSPDQTIVNGLLPFIKHETPMVRLFAIASLIRHDVKNATHWAKIGEEDRHPFVRMLSFEYVSDKPALSEAKLERYLQDLLRYSHLPPLKQLDTLVELRMARSEYRKALALHELRLKYTTASSPNRARAIKRYDRLRQLARP